MAGRLRYSAAKAAERLITARRTDSAAVLVVAGEASGDALAAGAIKALGVRAVGMGGIELECVGTELAVSSLDLAAMGPLDALARAPRLYAAYRRLTRLVVAHSPRAALLVGFSAFNARLGRWLKRRGTRVLWAAPPQVWAWGKKRVHGFAHSCHEVALLLPFEPPLWRSAGVAATYVGHPTSERQYASRQMLRRCLGFSDDETALALLPGSRSGEVRRMLEPMLGAVALLGKRMPVRARLLLSRALPSHDQRWARQLAREANVETLQECDNLPAFDGAFATSGTVTLDCALAKVPQVIAYRTDALTALLARRLLTTPHIGLPNVVLGRLAFPELLQSEVNAASLCEQMQILLRTPEHYRRQCEQVQALLKVPGGTPTCERVAELLRPWLD